jgi:hypothetical protein
MVLSKKKGVRRGGKRTEGLEGGGGGIVRERDRERGTERERRGGEEQKKKGHSTALVSPLKQILVILTLVIYKILETNPRPLQPILY